MVTVAVRKRILELCYARHLTIYRLALLSGLPPSTVMDLVNGKTCSPGTITIKLLCDGLEMSITEFFDSPLFASLEPEP